MSNRTIQRALGKEQLLWAHLQPPHWTLPGVTQKSILVIKPVQVLDPFTSALSQGMGNWQTTATHAPCLLALIGFSHNKEPAGDQGMEEREVGYLCRLPSYHMVGCRVIVAGSSRMGPSSWAGPLPGHSPIQSLLLPFSSPLTLLVPCSFSLGASVAPLLHDPQPCPHL